MYSAIYVLILIAVFVFGFLLGAAIFSHPTMQDESKDEDEDA